MNGLKRSLKVCSRQEEEKLKKALMLIMMSRFQRVSETLINTPYLGDRSRAERRSATRKPYARWNFWPEANFLDVFKSAL